MEELRHCPASPADLYGDLYALDGKNPYVRELPEPDVYILTTGGHRIPAHSGILASASPVLESIIDSPPRKHQNSGKLIPMLGVPCEAVAAFIRFIYSSRCREEEMEKYDIHLLALGHVYSVPQLKQRCTRVLGERLTLENAVDLLQLSRLCYAPDLHIRCMKLLSNTNFKALQQTEGWKFLQDHDPHLELQVLKFIDECESRKKRTRRYREERRLYEQLSEAMSCLEHIYTEGCTGVSPVDAADQPAASRKRESCAHFTTCHALQQLIRHLAGCRKREKGGCSRCKRMWQLLRLHSFICDQPEAYPCRVPLCRKFKLRAQQERRKDDGMWKLLARKVVSAKAMTSISQTQAKRKRSLEKSRESSGGSDDLYRIRTRRQSFL
ncbi:hypothetical protein SAY86_003752 [Trapa natans]|uniref:BTB domain-containing protein n=1 Tax=Trapa natans TaxID=22666 RepID=A0AAN7MX74_TRANT|nr:hypothetical protein SAY86_003752 [Trapa natans]